MSPTKQRACGTSGCRLAPTAAPYRLNDGKATHMVALPVTLLLAEPCLRRFIEGPSIETAAAVCRGYSVVRSYDDALAHGLA